MDDLISRQAVLEEIDRASRKYAANFFIGLSVAADIVAKQPAAERPKGEWIYEMETEMFQCSECKGMAVRNDYPFCHWCGAEMETEYDD